MTICSGDECNGFSPPTHGTQWRLDPWHPCICEQCDGNGFLIGIGNRKIPCDEKCSKCGRSVHLVEKIIHTQNEGAEIDELKFLNNLEFIPVEGPENLEVVQKIAECRVRADVPIDSPITYIDPHTFERTHLSGKVKVVFALLRLPVRTNGGGVYKIAVLIPPQEDTVLPRLINNGVVIE